MARPENADAVAIVGAGITGLSIAWHLARASAGRVTLYDGSGVGAGATAIQPGGVRPAVGHAARLRDGAGVVSLLLRRR